MRDDGHFLQVLFAGFVVLVLAMAVTGRLDRLTRPLQALSLRADAGR